MADPTDSRAAEPDPPADDPDDPDDAKDGDDPAHGVEPQAPPEGVEGATDFSVIDE